MIDDYKDAKIYLMEQFQQGDLSNYFLNNIITNYKNDQKRARES